MATPQTDPADTAATVLISGEDAVTRESYTKTYNSDGTSSLIETYKGKEDLMDDFYGELQTSIGNVSELSLTVQKASGSLDVTYNSDSGNEEAEDTVPEWSLDIIEIMRPLASHPYFQRIYVAAAGYDITEELARADLALAQGEAYTGDGFYDDWVGRYYALRSAGVVQYPALGLELKKSFVTSDTAIITGSYMGIGKVESIAHIAPPDIILAAEAGMESIASYASSDPNSAVYLPGGWEWAKRPSRLAMAGNEDSNTAKIEETWWGMDRWSKVIYPGDQLQLANFPGGTWDPPQ